MPEVLLYKERGVSEGKVLFRNDARYFPARLLRGRPSVGFFEDGHGKDFYIEPDRPVFEVEQVVLHSFFEGGVLAQAMHLSPAGDAGLDHVPRHVAMDIAFELFDEERAFGPGPDQTHIAFENVYQLRQFVDIEFS